LIYDDKRRAIGFEAGDDRLSPGKAGTDGRIDHRREDFSGHRRVGNVSHWRCAAG
jgi:hypothetical protein